MEKATNLGVAVPRELFIAGNSRGLRWPTGLKARIDPQRLSGELANTWVVVLHGSAAGRKVGMVP